MYKEIAREDTAVGQKLPHKGKNREECQDWWSGFWRAYTLDIIMTLHERDKWEDDDDLGNVQGARNKMVGSRWRRKTLPIY